MLKKHTIILAVFLITLSVLLHLAHYAIFQDAHHIFIYLIADLAFIPLEVFFVGLILEKIIERREKSAMLKKLNMLIGIFYQELGNKLLKNIVQADKSICKDINNIKIDFSWNNENYKNLSEFLKKHKHSIDINKLSLIELDKLIFKNITMISNLLTNPSLSEHELFTDVLLSIFHLSEELKQRDLGNLSDYDLDHLTVDIKRVYKNLSIEWVEYMKHIQTEYPYLFLSAASNNPFESRSRINVEKEIIRNR